MLRGSFGAEVLAEMAERRVSCSGTTIGDADSITAYLKKMIDLSAAGPKMFGGSDQGVHNFIVHRKLVPGLHAHDNYDSTVFTAGCEPEQSYRWNAKDEIVRDDGAPYPILHQHDRYPAVTKRTAREAEARRNTMNAPASDPIVKWGNQGEHRRGTSTRSTYLRGVAILMVVVSHTFYTNRNRLLKGIQDFI